MGIKSNYTKFLKQIAGEDIFKPTHVTQFAFKKVAIDTSLYLYKFKAAMGDRWLSGFLNLIKCMSNNQVHCVFIFDGKAPVEKQAEQEQRKSGKRKLEDDISILESSLSEYYKSGEVCENLKRVKMSGEKFNPVDVEERIAKKQSQVIDIGPLDFEHLKEMMKIMGTPFYTAPTEAEKFCSKLCIDGLVDAVLSDDTDIIAYACPLSLSKLDTQTGFCSCVNHDELITALDLTEEQFIEHCIMCGTDYNKNIPKIGSVTAYKMLKEHGNIEGIRDKLKIDVSMLTHDVVTKLFREFDEYDIKEIPHCSVPDFEELQRFVNTNNLPVNVPYLSSVFGNRDIVFLES
jgi:flap endonuclease-1